MKDSRYKQLMIDVGMPNSSSLLASLKQVANEVEQEKQSDIDAALKKQREAIGNWPQYAGLTDKEARHVTLIQKVLKGISQSINATIEGDKP